MAIAKNVGVKAGKLVGWTGATLWKGAVLAAGAAGEAGSGFVEGVETGWEDRCVVMDAKIAKIKARNEARKAELLAAKAEAAPATAPAAA